MIANANIYLDHNATTAVDPEVRAAMEPYWSEVFGNPSSIHLHGQCARNAVDEARAQIAACVGAEPEEIFFVSGGTEANNTVLVGRQRACPTQRPLATSAVEHKALLAPAEYLCATLGRTHLSLPVTSLGALDLDAAAHLLRTHRPDLVSVMSVNNDTGVVQPVGEVAALAKETGAVIHTDAVQALGKIPVDLRAWDVDAASFSGHKIYGPKGIGALFVRRGTKIAPLLLGGPQESRRRAGTENVALIAGFAAACRLAVERREADMARIGALRDRFERAVSQLDDVYVVGRDAHRVASCSYVVCRGIPAETMVMAMDLRGISVSAGSACQSDVRDPSYVLTAMGISPSDARSAVRITLGRTTTAQQIDTAAAAFAEAVTALRRGGP